MQEVRRPGASQVYWLGGLIVVAVLLIALLALSL